MKISRKTSLPPPNITVFCMFTRYMQEILFRYEKLLLDARNEIFSPSPNPISMSNTLQLPYKKLCGSKKGFLMMRKNLSLSN